MRKGKNGGKQLILLVELGGLELQPSGHCQEMGEARRSHSASFAPNEKDARRNICRGNCRARHSRKPAHRTTASRHRKAQQLQGNTNHAAAAKPYGLRRCDPYQPAVTLEPEGQGFRISRSALNTRRFHESDESVNSDYCSRSFASRSNKLSHYGGCLFRCTVSRFKCLDDAAEHPFHAFVSL